jgi:hypothetical protein
VILINSVSKIVRDLSYDNKKHYIGKGTFAFAVKLSGPTPELLLDTSYFAFTYEISKFKRNPGSGITIEFESIEMEYCGDNFPFVSSDIYSKMELSTFL